jgi:hypothetical protein
MPAATLRYSGCCSNLYLRFRASHGCILGRFLATDSTTPDSRRNRSGAAMSEIETMTQFVLHAVTAPSSLLIRIPSSSLFHTSSQLSETYCSHVPTFCSAYHSNISPPPHTHTPPMLKSALMY